MPTLSPVGSPCSSAYLGTMLRGLPTVMGSRPASSISTVRVVFAGLQIGQIQLYRPEHGPQDVRARIFIGHDDGLVGFQRRRNSPNRLPRPVRAGFAPIRTRADSPTRSP